MRAISIIFIMMFWLICLNSTRAQTWTAIPKMTTPVTPSLFFQYDNNSFPPYKHYVGVGINNITPSAFFHIYEPLPSVDALFQTEATQGGSTLGFIKHWFTSSSVKYGFYESSLTGSEVQNYFQDPVIFGNMTISGTLINHTSFLTGYGNGFINFIMGPAVANDTVIPLSIRRTGIRVRTNMVTDSLQLLTNPGLNKVLVSDANGRGDWTDASTFGDNKWLINKDSDIYANPLRHHVGIGFQNSNEKIYQMFSILNGNILLTRNTSTIKSPMNKPGSIGEAPTSKNGSILFGDTVYGSNTLGEWGIEYETNDSTYASNGLNFWKPYSSGNGGGDHYLYLRNDGNIGIGTNKTLGYKLAIAGGILCNEVKVRKFAADWPDYVLKDEYKMQDLSELAAYINEHQRLPEMPSAKEVSENGVDVGAMDVTLVKKIEELTKYLLEQQKQILDQQNKLIDQQKQIDELKRIIENK